MKVIEKIRAYAKVMRERRRDAPLDELGLLRQRPLLALGVSAFETVQALCGRVDSRLKALAQIKTSSMVGCPF